MGASGTEFDAEYGADQIQILEGLEAVRKRPGMYIGSVSTRGLNHLIYEIVDNAVDMCFSEDVDSEEWDLNELNQLILSMIPMQAVTPEDVDSVKNNKCRIYCINGISYFGGCT